MKNQEKITPCTDVVTRITPTVYLMDIDNEVTVVIAENIADAMDKAEKISKINYKMVYSKSLPLLY